MFGVFQQVENGRRLLAHRWQAQVVSGQVRAGRVLDAFPEGVVVDHQRRPVGVGLLPASATLATLALLAGGRAIAEQPGQAVAVPLIGPEQAREGEQKVKQQAPGAGHGVQVPVEGAALFGPVQGQPYAPVKSLARPAQVQAGEAEENQDQGAGTGDLAPAVADGEEAVQAQHQVEKALAADVALERAGVGVEVAHRPTAFARRRCEVHLGSHVAVGLNPE
ncbi:hypothetical protein D3C80_1125880 [compost metagenome]